jgi:hypothetical protein
MPSPKKDDNRLHVERHFPVREKIYQLPVTPQFGVAWICHCPVFRGKAIPKARLLHFARNDISNPQLGRAVFVIARPSGRGNLRSFGRLLATLAMIGLG